jgi:hypothetical protein
VPSRAFDIPAAAQHAKNQDVFVLDAIDDDVAAYGEAPKAGTQIQVALPSDIGMRGEESETAGDRVNEAVCGFQAAAPACHVIPNVVEIGFGWR